MSGMRAAGARPRCAPCSTSLIRSWARSPPLARSAAHPRHRDPELGCATVSTHLSEDARCGVLLSSRTGPRRRPGKRSRRHPGGSELSTFQALGIGDRSVAALAARGIDTPVQVQIETIPALLNGRDAVIEAPTGSGKTLAYLLPMVQRLARPGRGPRALVVTPVRELALQVDAVYRGLGASGGAAALYGGV